MGGFDVVGMVNAFTSLSFKIPRGGSAEDDEEERCKPPLPASLVALQAWL